MPEAVDGISRTLGILPISRPIVSIFSQQNIGVVAEAAQGRRVHRVEGAVAHRLVDLAHVAADRGGDDQDRAGILRHDPAGRLDAVDPRHDQVHQDQVGAVAPGHRDRLGARRRPSRRPGGRAPTDTTRRSASRARAMSLTIPILIASGFADQVGHRVEERLVVEAALGQVAVGAGVEAAHPVLLAVLVRDDHDGHRLQPAGLP